MLADNKIIIKTTYLKFEIDKDGRRISSTKSLFDLVKTYLRGKLIQIIRYRHTQPLIRIGNNIIEPEALRQLLIWIEKDNEPNLIIKNFNDDAVIVTNMDCKHD